MGSARVITDSPAGALAEVRAHRAAADAHEAAILQAAAEWADRHPHTHRPAAAGHQA